VALPPDIVAGVAQRLAAHAGLEPPLWVVEARVAARLAVLGCEPARYLELIDTSRGGAEIAELVEAVRVGESRLFRHRPQIAALVDTVIPAWRAAGKRAIKVWSAGCAAGEEPYTLAAVLARNLPGWPIAIVATDVSADALEVARGAAYPLDELDDVPDEYRDCFMVASPTNVGRAAPPEAVRCVIDEIVRVRPEIASLVKFERANLVDGAPVQRGFDLVWCRNVLIYFTPAARRRAIETLVTATAMRGCVFVGYSESLRDVPDLEPVRAGDAVYYVRRELRATPVPMRPTPMQGVPIAPSAPIRAPRTFARPPTDPGVLVLRGTPDVAALTGELALRLATATADALTVDLDGADLLEDELAPVLRRARAAARSAGKELVMRATRTGAKRWLARHGLDPNEDDAP
jgi:chemotaxis protein methyltransferase CheR